MPFSQIIWSQITLDEGVFADYSSDISLSLRSYYLTRLSLWTAYISIVQIVPFDYNNYSRRGTRAVEGELKLKA